MITASLKINVPIEKHRDALQTVQSILGRKSAQPGCISIAFYQDTDSPGTLMLIEEWEDWRSVENHVRSDSYRSILELMELSPTPPEIKFCSVSKTQGMEVLERLSG